MGVREIPAEEITNTVQGLCIEAVTILGRDGSYAMFGGR